MGDDHRIVFDPFSLDLTNECLWRGSEAIKLRPKAFAVLHHLIGSSGQLVTKEELLSVIWPETFVSDAVLKVTIRQLREALDDDPKSPRYIETAHRRGYRFIGRIAPHEPVLPAEQLLTRTAFAPLSVSDKQAIRDFVGRDEVLLQMHEWLQRALAGERQIVFVTGEAGIGKTSLVDAFVQSIVSAGAIRIATGQCLEQYGTSEAYLPVLEAIGRMCRQHPEVVDLLRAHAPTWLLQMPSLVSASDREALSREVFGATRERMLREMGHALEALTVDVPLVLILEDLHWSDFSTLDLVSYLAQQRHPARFMMIGTYRPVELILSGHPLRSVKQELLAKHQCQELPLEYLNEAAIAEYLSLRFPGNQFPAQLPGLIQERTEGNPLFMVNVLDYFWAEGLITETDEQWRLNTGLEELEVGVPENIRQIIAKQIDRLSTEDQQVLEAASISGMNFSALAIASALGEDAVAVEGRCEDLTRRNCFLRARGVGEFPDGTVSARYEFIHSLYVNTLYDRIPAARRARLHKDMAERGEIIYGSRVGEIAAELAMHFERGRDYQRAAKYLQKTADIAIRRFAYREAVGLARRGLELLARAPDTRERTEQELCLQLTLGVPLVATEGYAAPDVGSTYTRARELCHQLGETPDIGEVLWGLRSYHILRAEFGIAREIGEELLRLAERQPYPGLAMLGHWAMESTFMHMGEFTLSMEHFEKALLLYDPKRHLDDSFLYALNPGVAMPCLAAWSLWFLGQPDHASRQIQQALTLARELSEPQGLAHALFCGMILNQLCREDGLAQENAEAAIVVSSEHGLVFYQAMARIIRGWALIEQGLEEEGIEQMRQGLAAHRLTGVQVFLPHFLALMAEALGKTRQPEEGLRVLEEALDMAHRNGEGKYEAELYRIKGELLLIQSAGRGVSRAAVGGKVSVKSKPSAVADAESCFNQSIKIAQRQKAKSLELRAAMSMAGLYQSQGKKKEARGLVAQIYDSFTEGFETMDLREAKALIAELA